MATAEGAVRHSAVAKAAAGFRAELDAAGAASGGLHRAIQQRAFQEAGDLAVDDGEIFREAGFSERVGALGAKAVVIGRIDAAVGNHRVAAAVNVNAVAVGVHRHVVHGQVVAAGDENRKMSAVKNRDVADEHIAAKFQREGLVAETNRRRGVGDRRIEMIEADHLIENLVSANQTATVDRAVAADENVRQIFAPNQAVMKIAMSAVLITTKRIWLGLVIKIHVLRRAQNRCARVNQQMDVALEMNRAAQISSRRHEHRAATGLGAGSNRLVNRRAVEIFSVAHRAESAHVKITLAGHFSGVQDSAQAEQDKKKVGEESYFFHGGMAMWFRWKL